MQGDERPVIGLREQASVLKEFVDGRPAEEVVGPVRWLDLLTGEEITDPEVIRRLEESYANDHDCP